MSDAGTGPALGVKTALIEAGVASAVPGDDLAALLILLLVVSRCGLSRYLGVMIWLWAMACVIEDGGAYPALDARYEDYASDGTGQVGERMNPFVLPDQHGDLVDFRQFLGAPVVIDVGALWCEPCKEAAQTSPSLFADLQAQDGWLITVLAQNVGGGVPSVGDCADWADTYGLDYPVLADEIQEWTDRWKIRAWPTWFVVAADGEIVERLEGPQDEATLRRAIDGAR